MSVPATLLLLSLSTVTTVAVDPVVGEAVGIVEYISVGDDVGRFVSKFSCGDQVPACGDRYVKGKSAERGGETREEGRLRSKFAGAKGLFFTVFGSAKSNALRG